MGTLGLGLSLNAVAARRVGVVDPSTGYTLYLPFAAATPTYRKGAATYTDESLIPGRTYTRTGAKSEMQASGGPSASFAANVPAIVPGVGYYARSGATNLLLNAGGSGNLSTQSVAVTAQAYTLAFVGTGSITLSGASTAGPLVGISATDRVVLTFTPTAGTLTLTVSGNATYATLIAGSRADGGPIIQTAGATASTGIDLLKIALTQNEADFFFWAVVNRKNTGVDLYISQPAGGGTLYLSTGGALTHSNGGGATASVFNVTGRMFLGLRRSGGQWTLIGKTPSGVVYKGSSAAGTAPAWTNVGVGLNAFDNNAANEAIEGIYLKPGTFTDAECEALFF